MAQSLDNGRFSRQIQAFGQTGQEKIAATKVGIVGLGGLGSHISQLLAYLGTRFFTLVDDDTVELSNLNRLIGATLRDAGQSKVAVAARVIQAVSPSAHTRALKSNLINSEVFEALKQCDVVFGCLDNDGARLVLTELSAAYDIPLIDCASEIILGHDGNLEYWGGRVLVALPGERCAVCAGQVDLEVARQELETESERRFRANHGYGLGEQFPTPAVVSLNGVVANLAVTEFLVYVTQMRQPAHFLTYKADRGVVISRNNPRNETCYICRAVAGQREAAHVERYLSTDLPQDIPQ